MGVIDNDHVETRALVEWCLNREKFRIRDFWFQDRILQQFR
jgi:hypothetical protein